MSICRDFLNNKCKREKCKFLHPSKILQRHETVLHPRVKGKNTISWTPLEKEEDMRIMFDFADKLSIKWTPRDVLIVPTLFQTYKPFSIYEILVKEIEQAKSSLKNGESLLKLWHGNQTIEGTHVIADDHQNWKEHVPMFQTIVNQIANWFNMKVESTRFNWYRDDNEWKPFHHDRAAVEAKIALKQNITVAVSFGQTRGCAFEHAKNKTVINFPQPDGCVYAFFDTTNVIWRHGVFPNRSHENQENSPKGRISIILWGWVEQ